MPGQGRDAATHVNQVDGVSDMVPLLCVSVWGMAQKKKKMASARPLEFRLGGSCPLGTHPDARHCSFSPYATDALQAALPMLEPRVSESEQVLSLF